MKEEVDHFFSKEDEQQIVNAIREAERHTSGEIRVHLENHTDEPNLEHAKHIFEKVGMTKTALRNGVLFYLAFKDHQFSIIGDKGIDEVTPEDFWNHIRDLMQEKFRKGQFKEGLIEGIREAGVALKKYFPREDDDTNELTNEISRS
jgi:uncharacterized membrane protein